MKCLTTSLTVYVAIIFVFFSVITNAANQGKLCMRTFKTICQICYDQQDTKEFISCQKRQCLERDDNDYCVKEGPAIVLTSDSCLPQCCDGSGIQGSFNEKKFNSCIEYDADRPNDINIGMTLGAMLSLFLLLGLFGAAYLLSILCFDQKYMHDNGKKPLSSGQLKQGGLLISSYEPRWIEGKEVEKRLSGPCVKCKQKGINSMTFCKHGYHSKCIIPSNKQDFQCLSCNNSWQTLNIFCDKCHKNFFIYRLQSENYEGFSQVKCKQCESE